MSKIIKPKVIKPVAESYWVIPDRLLAGEHPAGDAQEIERRLGALLDAGFNAFIDLTEPGELPPYDTDLPRASRLLAQADPRSRGARAPRT